MRDDRHIGFNSGWMSVLAKKRLEIWDQYRLRGVPVDEDKYQGNLKTYERITGKRHEPARYKYLIPRWTYGDRNQNPHYDVELPDDFDPEQRDNRPLWGPGGASEEIRKRGYGKKP